MRINFFYKYKNNFLLSGFITLAVLLPDIIATYKFTHYMIYSLVIFIEILFTFCIAFFTTFLQTSYLLAVVSLLVGMGVVEVLNYAFFYAPINSYDWMLLSEIEDIIGSLKSIEGYIVVALIILIILFLILHFFLKKIQVKQNKYAKYCLLISFAMFIIVVNIYKNSFPSKKHLSYIDTFSTIILATVHALEPSEAKQFIPYSIMKSTQQVPIVIVIMGESLNPVKMNLFGAKISNTPLLNSLKKDKHFSYKLALSGGVNTEVSVPTFFTLKREPLNRQLEISNKTNLLKLAKENGYITYWISTQKEGKETSAILLRYADIKKTRKDWSKKPLYDDVLLQYLKDIPFGRKIFLVLHLRANHSPYEDYTPKRYQKLKYDFNDYKKYKENSYSNSILYVDHILFSIIKYMKKYKKRYTIYFTSDHGEMLGDRVDKWKYGHSQLDINCAKVPFLYYSNTNNHTLTNKIYSHNQIARMVANDLGYKINNPNDNGYCYINGVDLFGHWGFLKYKLNQQEKNYKDIKTSKIE